MSMLRTQFCTFSQYENHFLHLECGQSIKWDAVKLCLLPLVKPSTCCPAAESLLCLIIAKFFVCRWARKISKKKKKKKCDGRSGTAEIGGKRSSRRLQSVRKHQSFICFEATSNQFHPGRFRANHVAEGRQLASAVWTEEECRQADGRRDGRTDGPTSSWSDLHSDIYAATGHCGIPFTLANVLNPTHTRQSLQVHDSFFAKIKHFSKF